VLSKLSSFHISLQARAIFLLILLIAFFEYVSVNVVSGWFTNQEKKNLEEHLDVLLEVQGNSLITPLWEFDLDEVQRLATLLGNNELVAHVSVRDSYVPENGLREEFAAYGLKPRGDPFSVSGEFTINEPKSGELIGVLAITLSGHHVAKSLQQIEFGLMCGGIVCLLVLSCIAIACIEILMNPLRRLTKVMHSLAEDNLSIMIPALDRRDEIGAMARSIKVFKTHAINVNNLTDQLKSQAIELRSSLEKEKELCRVQREFVSMVSHEFRTPLTIIAGATRRIGKLTERQSSSRLVERLEDIGQAVIRMTDLVESTLSSSQLENGTYKYEPQSFDIRALVVDVCRLHDSVAPHHNIDLDLDLLPDNVFGDQRLLRQVVTNLISNATKYSPNSGDISVKGWSDKGNLQISFTDQGVGIPNDELSEVFKRFARARTSVGIPGTGIGLHLSKEIMNMHGGDIELKSAEGRGSTFTIRMPIAALEARRAEDDQSIDDLFELSEV